MGFLDFCAKYLNGVFTKKYNKMNDHKKKKKNKYKNKSKMIKNITY